MGPHSPALLVPTPDLTTAELTEAVSRLKQGHSNTEPVVEPRLPNGTDRQGKSTADQVTLLTQDIGDSSRDNVKAGLELLDLTAAYDTV